MCIPMYINQSKETVPYYSTTALLFKGLESLKDELLDSFLSVPKLRLYSCFRDDLAFLWLFIQVLIYPVDPDRPNDLGQINRSPTTDEIDEVLGVTVIMPPEKTPKKDKGTKMQKGSVKIEDHDENNEADTDVYRRKQ